MNIVILGAGEVGSFVAKVLIKKSHNVVLIDKDSAKLEQLKDTLEIGTIVGEGTDWEILTKAEVNNADLFLAATDVDEVNLISCIMAKDKDKYRELFRIDNMLSTETLAASEIAKSLGYPGILILEDFAKGRIQIRQYQLDSTAQKILVLPLKEVSLPKDILIASLFREGKFIIPKGDVALRKGDIITIIGSPESIPEFESIINIKENSLRATVIVGGGLLGFTLAKILEARRLPVKIIERNKDRCKWLAEKLPRTTIINGDATNTALLEEEYIDQSDAFVAATGDDETNLLSCLLAKSLKIKNTICISHKPEYTSIIENSGINLAVSPRNVTANNIITLLHREKIISAALINEGKGEIFELYASPSSNIVDKPLSDLNLPASVLIGGIIHEQELVIPTGKDIIRAGDIVLVICDIKSVDKARGLINP
jgi:trk system potassium uptake protein TrkA